MVDEINIRTIQDTMKFLETPEARRQSKYLEFYVEEITKILLNFGTPTGARTCFLYGEYGVKVAISMSKLKKRDLLHIKK